MYVCACVRACVRVFNCVSCSRDKENVRARREFYRERERERERARRKDFFRFFYLFCVLSCLVFFSSTLPLECEGKEKKTNYHTEKLFAGPFLETKEKQSLRRKKRQSVRAEPFPRPRPSGTAATLIELSSQPSSSRFLRSIRVRASTSVSLCAVCACETLVSINTKTNPLIVAAGDFRTHRNENKRERVHDCERND